MLKMIDILTKYAFYYKIDVVNSDLHYNELERMCVFCVQEF